MTIAGLQTWQFVGSGVIVATGLGLEAQQALIRRRYKKELLDWEGEQVYGLKKELKRAMKRPSRINSHEKIFAYSTNIFNILNRLLDTQNPQGSADVEINYDEENDHNFLNLKRGEDGTITLSRRVERDQRSAAETMAITLTGFFTGDGSYDDQPPHPFDQIIFAPPGNENSHIEYIDSAFRYVVSAYEPAKLANYSLGSARPEEGIPYPFIAQSLNRVLGDIIRNPWPHPANAT